MANKPNTTTLVLTKPREFNFNGTNGPDTGWEFTTADGEKYSTFDGALVKVFLEKELALKPTEFEWYPPKQNGKPPTIVGIAGLYRKSGGGGRGYGGGGGLTNRQVALLAAVAATNGKPEMTTTKVFTVAQSFLAWLDGGGPAGGSGQSSAASKPVAQSPSVPDSSEDTHPPAGSSPAPIPEALAEAAAKVWPNRPALAEAYFRSKSQANGGVVIADLDNETQKAILDELIGMAVASDAFEGANNGN